MNIVLHLAKHIRDVYFGGNWTAVNLKDTLTDIDWQTATRKVDSLNTILALVYHIDYYVTAVNSVLENKLLKAHDKYSFDHPTINSQQDWETFLEKVWENARNLSNLIEQLPENKLWEIFADEKYGNYYRNIQGLTEHTHYHLGQIVLLKKLLKDQGN